MLKTTPKTGDSIMYNPDRIIENGVFMDGDKIPRSRKYDYR